MTKIFPHRTRKLRPLQGRLVIAEDPVARSLRTETERCQSDRLEAGRQARQAQRREVQQRHEADVDKIERLAAAAFPWDRLRQRRAIVDAVVRFPQCRKRPFTGVASWWSLIVVFAPSPESAAHRLPRAVFNVLRATCPYTFDLPAIEPLIALQVARLGGCGDDFNAEAFREQALAAARAQIERRRRAMLTLAAVNAIPVDLGGGWFAYNAGFDHEGTLVMPGGIARRIASTPVSAPPSRPHRWVVQDRPAPGTRNGEPPKNKPLTSTVAG
jgi:hypothetical protein